MDYKYKNNNASSLLIGNSKYNSNKKQLGSNILLGRKNNNASSLLVGKLNDRDKDGYPDIMDCNQNNPKEHGVFKNIISKIIPSKKTEPNKTNQNALGPVMLRESQATSSNIKSITDKGATVQVVSSTAPASTGSKQSSVSSRSGGSSSASSRITEPYNVKNQIKETFTPDPSKPKVPTQPTVDIPVRPTQTSYNYNTGMYETKKSYDYGQGTTQVTDLRLPSLEQQEVIDKRESLAYTANIPKLEQDIKEEESRKNRTNRNVEKIDEIDKQIKVLIRDKVNVDNTFTGSESEYKEYLNLYNKRDKIYNEYLRDSSIKGRELNFNVFNKDDSNKVPIANLRPTKTFGVGSQIGLTYFNKIPEQIGSNVGEFYKQTTSGIKEGKITGGIISDQRFNLINSDKVGKITSDILGIAKYSVPVIGTLGFAGELGTEIERTGNVKQYVRENPLGTGIIVGSLALGPISRIISKNIPRTKYAGLSRKNYVKFLEQAGQDVKKLDDAKIKWVSVEEKGGGVVELVGKQKKGKLTKDIKIQGELSKTELDKIILTGAGEYSTSGIAYLTKSKKKIPFQYGEVGIFESGSKAVSIFKGRIGNIKLFDSIGRSTSKPITSTRFGFKVGTSEAKATKQVFAQRQSNILLGGSPTIDISRKTIAQLNENMALTFGKKDLGLMLKVRDKGTQFDLITGGTIDISKLIDKGSKIIGGKKTPLSKTFQQLDNTEQILFRTPTIPKSQTSKVTSSIKSQTLTSRANQLSTLITRPASIELVREVNKVKGVSQVKMNQSSVSFLSTSSVKQTQTPLLTTSTSQGSRTTSLTGSSLINTSKPLTINQPIQQIPKPTNPAINQPISIAPIFPVELRKKPEFKSTQGYDVKILREATKQGKARYEKINTTPLTLESARSRGLREVDNSISAKYVIEKAKDIIKKVNGKTIKEKPKALDTKDNYFEVNKFKVRDYKISKGKKVPITTGMYIENASYRADKPREVRTLQRSRTKFFGI